MNDNGRDGQEFQPGRRMLVTGGAGFIGSNLVKHLLAQGHTVVVLDNMLSGCRQNLAPFPEVEFMEGDIRDVTAVERAMRDVEVVFHLAASVGNKRSIEHPLDDAETKHRSGAVCVVGGDARTRRRDFCARRG